MKLIWLNSLKTNEIAINSKLYKKLMEPKSIKVHYGMLNINSNVIINEKLPEGAIGLPINFSKKYTIPQNIPYEAYFKDKEFYIGPIIAYISMESNQFSKSSYAYNLPSFIDYNSIKGLIIICTEDNINLDAGIIEGYYLDPNEKKNDDVWKYGKFPLPNAFFSRSFLSQEKVKVIQSIIGDKLFNSYLLNLDKWQTYKFLSKNPKLKKHLPYTKEFDNINQLKSLLDRFGSLYLKPCNDGGGIGIMKLEKTKAGISLIDNESKEHSYKNYDKLSKFLKNRIAHVIEKTAKSKSRNPKLNQFLSNSSKSPYIVQQAVNFKNKNRNVDFRLILQKNSKFQWESSGLFARIAKEGSIITNKRGRDKMINGKKALTSIYGVSEKKAIQLELEITDLVTRVVNMYENLGYHLADVAADITIDSSLNIWILELQLYYSISGWNTEGIRSFYEKLSTTPFQYAKALAGFIKGQ